MADSVRRLNYIGSKFQLLDWITTSIQEKTQWSLFENKVIADLFAGTGIVSYHFRKKDACILSNDAELYSSIIASALTRSNNNSITQRILDELQTEIAEEKYQETVGYITTHYSPYGDNERMFFTIDNAKRIDYLRGRLEALKPTLTPDNYAFLLASLLLGADAVSNVPAVYGCFLKRFKAKALKPLPLLPIHTFLAPPHPNSQTTHSDVLNPELLASLKADLVYLDPPYNERQYSKNYFPLNMIAKSPEVLLTEDPLKGKTGIPTDCFLSPFCKKGAPVEKAFETLFRQLNAEWIVLSYNSESLIEKNKMMELMGRFGDVSVMERDYKRFKSFEYNDTKPIQEYLFFLHKTPQASF